MSAAAGRQQALGIQGFLGAPAVLFIWNGVEGRGAPALRGGSWGQAGWLRVGVRTPVSLAGTYRGLTGMSSTGERRGGCPFNRLRDPERR